MIWKKVENPICSRCQVILTIQNWPSYLRAPRTNRRRFLCRDCATIDHRRYRAKYRPKIRAYGIAYRLTHRSQWQAERRRYYRKHKDRILALRKTQWRKFLDKLRYDVIGHYSKGKYACVCCTETTFLFLSIDHINGGGHKDRHTGTALYRWLRMHDYPLGYQVLCMNCNWGRARNGGICPHKGIRVPLLTENAVKP
jgi:hypothetical protein